MVVASAGEEMGEAKALVTANPASPVKTGKTLPLKKRKLMGPEEPPRKKLRLESSVLSQPVEQRVKGKLSLDGFLHNGEAGMVDVLITRGRNDPVKVLTSEQLISCYAGAIFRRVHRVCFST